MGQPDSDGSSDSWGELYCAAAELAPFTRPRRAVHPTRRSPEEEQHAVQCGGDDLEVIWTAVGVGCVALSDMVVPPLTQERVAIAFSRLLEDERVVLIQTGEGEVGVQLKMNIIRL